MNDINNFEECLIELGKAVSAINQFATSEKFPEPRGADVATLLRLLTEMSGLAHILYFPQLQEAASTIASALNAARSRSTSCEKAKSLLLSEIQSLVVMAQHAIEFRVESGSPAHCNIQSLRDFTANLLA